MSAIFSRPSGPDECTILSLFPFFIVVDEQFKITRLGNHMKSSIHGARVGAHISEVIKMRLPLKTVESRDWIWSSLQIVSESQVSASCIYSKDFSDVNLLGRFTLFKSDNNEESIRGALFLLQPEIPVGLELSFIPNYLLGGYDNNSRRQDFIDKDNDLFLLLLERLEDSERKNKEIRLQLEETQRSLERKSTFVRYVSHEICTPLNTVAMGLKMLQESGFLGAINEKDGTAAGMSKFDDPVRPGGSSSFRIPDGSGFASPPLQSRRGMAADIKESCDIAIDIVNDLLLYEKLEGGILQLEKKIEPALSTVIEAVKTLEIQAKKVGIDLQFTFTSDDFAVEELDKPTVCMDVDMPKISQVMRNIVANALKFSPAGSIVSVHVDLFDVSSTSATPSGVLPVAASSVEVVAAAAVPSAASAPAASDAVTISASGLRETLESSASTSSAHAVKRMKVAVKDSGLGISPENQKNLFNNIIQFDANKRQDGGGSGLGLYISKGIMDLHGGSIGVFSEGEGKGTTLYIEIPVYLEPRVEKSNSPNMYYHPENGFFSATHVVQGVKVHQPAAAGKKKGANEINVVSLRQSMRSGKTTPAPEGGSGGGGSGANSGRVVSVSLRKYDEQRRRSASTVGTTSDNKERKEDTEVLIRSRVPNTINRVQNVRKEVMKILIVDDSRMHRRMTGRYLSGRDFCTKRPPDELSDGKEAVDSVLKSIATGEPYSAVLIDFVLPVMDGPTAVKRMRAGGYTGLVVGVTGSVNQAEIDHFTAHGADMVMSKPIDLDLLADVLKQITGDRDEQATGRGRAGGTLLGGETKDGAEDGVFGGVGIGDDENKHAAPGKKGGGGGGWGGGGTIHLTSLSGKQHQTTEEGDLFSFRTNSSKAMTSTSFRSNAALNSVPYSKQPQPLGVVVPESLAREAPSPLLQPEPANLMDNNRNCVNDQQQQLQSAGNAANASTNRSTIVRLIGGLFGFWNQNPQQVLPQPPPGKAHDAASNNVNASQGRSITAAAADQQRNPSSPDKPTKPNSAPVTSHIPGNFLTPGLTNTNRYMNSTRSAGGGTSTAHPQRVWSRSAASYRQAGAGSSFHQGTSMHQATSIRQQVPQHGGAGAQ